MDFSETTFNDTVDQEPVEYEYKEKKNTNYKALITYAIAVVCLLLGLFLPLFGEKGILALQLPEVVNGLFKTSFEFGKPFASKVTYPIVQLFGIEKLEVNLLYWVTLLYAVITVLALLAVVPVGIASSKGKRSANVWAYIFETAAVVVLSVYLIMAIPGVCADKKAIDYSLLIAFGGPLLILIVQAFMFKKATGFVKVVLFLLSAIALFAMFNVFALIPKLVEPVEKLLKDKITIWGLMGSTDGGNSGIGFIQMLFISGFKTIGDVLKLMPEAKDKAVLLLGIILCTLIVLNYFFDILGLSSKGKSAGYLFNLIRYGLETAAFIALIITVIVAKYTLGVLLILVGVMAVLQLLISLIRFLMNHKRKKRAKAGDYDEEYVEETEEYDFGSDDYYAAEKKPQSPPATQSGTYNTIIPDNYTNEPQPFAPPAEPVTFQVYDEAAPSTVQAEPVFTEPAPVQAAEPVVEPKFVSAPVERPVVTEEPATFTPAPTFSEPAVVQPELEEHGDAFQSRTPFGEGVTNPAPSFYEPAEDTSEPEEDALPPYSSDTDEFMDKLSNEEKYEFADLFINKTRTDLGKIPTYNVNGNNKKFFSAVFIYLGKIRPVISNGLLNKIYQEMKML